MMLMKNCITDVDFRKRILHSHHF